MQPRSYSDITPEMIQDWKLKYGELQQIDVELEEGKTASFIARRPNRSVMDAIGEYGVKKQVAEANKVLIANCVLGGDMDLMENDGSVYTALLEQLERLVTRKRASVKKL